MCTWLWDPLPEREKPTNENTLKRGGCSIPPKLSTTNNTSESLEIAFHIARILVSLILFMSWTGDHNWFWAYGCSHVLFQQTCHCSLSILWLVDSFFLVLHWWLSPEHHQRVSVLIKNPHLVLYLSTSGVLWVHISSGSYCCHSPRVHHWQPVLPPALCSCSV